MKARDLAAIALGALCCAAVLLARAADPAEVAAPALKVGERWVYRTSGYAGGGAFDRIEVEVTAVDDKLVHTVYSGAEGKELDVTWTPQWNAVVDPRGAIWRPNSRGMQFPLRAGDRREAEAELQFTREPPPGVRRPPAGARVQMSRTIRVVGWEDVEVPAGRFRALRIDSENVARRLDASVPDTRSRAQTWYAPEVKRWVKQVVLLPTYTVTEELIEYRVR